MATTKRVDMKATMKNVIGRINSSPAFAFHIPDMKKFKDVCNSSEKDMKDVAKFVGTQVEYA